ncbi:hypothetical protein SRIMM317S_06345 [Streptomyces rimosus subsp. rimosus]
MKIVVHDTASAMDKLLRLPLEERPDALRELLAPLQDAMSVGGVDLMRMHEMGCGFRIDREDPRYLAALERMRDARVWERVRNSSVRRGSGCGPSSRRGCGPPRPCMWCWCSVIRTTTC